MTRPADGQAAINSDDFCTKAAIQADLEQAEPTASKSAIHDRGQSEAALAHMTILATFAEALSRLLDLDEILRFGLATALELVGMDEGGALLLDPTTNNLLLKAHIGGMPDLVRASSTVPVDEGMVPNMLAAVTAIDDLSMTSDRRRREMEKEGLQSLLSVPLVSSDRRLGMMVLAGHRTHRFTADELKLLDIMGRHIGSAVHRYHLQAQELRTAILEERQAMARQMHDDIAQTLGYLGLQIDTVMDHPSLTHNVQVQAQLEQVHAAIEKAYQRVRMSISRLGREIPEHYDLRIALQEIIDEFASATDCRVRSEIDIDWLAPLSPLVAIQASHIIHEALNNVRRHACASVVHVSLRKLDSDIIEVLVEDDGQGFDADSVSSSDERRFGLRFMAHIMRS